MTIGDTYTFSPTAVNSFHATFDRRRDNRASASNLFSPKDLGVNMFINVPNYTQLTVSGYSGGGFNVGCGTCALANFDINTYQVADDFTLIRGKHQIGFRLRWPQGPVQLLQQPAVQRSVHLQRRHQRRRIGGPADRPLLRLDRRQRDFRLPAPDGHGRLRAGCLPRHVALQHQHRRALGALRAGLRQVWARQPVQLAALPPGLAQLRYTPTLRRA